MLPSLVFYFQRNHKTARDTVAPSPKITSLQTRNPYTLNAVRSVSGYEILENKHCIRTVVAAADALDM
jgi:hypothetical protein